MTVRPPLAACLAAILLAGPALAQTAATATPATGKHLNLQLPPRDFPPPASSAPAATSAAPAPTSAPHAAAAQPGVYYGDTSGRAATTDADDGLASCDDSTYNQTQVHGTVGMGVVAGNHVSGNYQGGTVNLSRAFGDCDHPGGGMSISIGVSQGHFSGDHRHP